MGTESLSLQPNLIRPQLYLSSLRTEVYKSILDEFGITHILQVGVELRPTHPKDYKYLQLPVYDIVEQDIVGSFPAAFDFIDKAIGEGGIVLVHCQAGVSRSASVVIGYCMWKDKLSAEAATQAVTTARSSIWPNAGFKCQLREFESLAWDASKWRGWSMQKYLTKQYGDESVGFMSSMLGGPPVDRLRGPCPLPAAATGASAEQQSNANRSCSGNSQSCNAASSASEPSSDSSCSSCSSGDSSSSSRSGSRRQLHTSGSEPYAAATAAVAGVSALYGSMGRQPRGHSSQRRSFSYTSGGSTAWLGEEAALMMAG